jgi:hypothetical protein
MSAQHGSLKRDSSSLRDFLPPLAAAFNIPRQDFGDLFLNKIDAIIVGVDHVVSTTFPDVRDFLSQDPGIQPDSEKLKSLTGVIGTGVTLLEALCEMGRQKNIDADRLVKLRSLLDEYKKLFEDIELFSEDISAEDCFIAACESGVLSDWNKPEEDAAWQDL